MCICKAVCMLLIIWNVTLLSIEATNNSISRDVMILEELMSNYDSRVGPFVYAGKATVIKMSMYILEMESFNDLEMAFTMVIYFRRTWNDPRLTFNHLSSDTSPIYVREFKDIWWPDIFFVNERDSKLHVTTLPNSSTRIESDGTVFVSSKYSVTFACPMDMRNFPMDTQTCKMEIESYSYPLSLVQFEWMDSTALELPPDLFLTQVTLLDSELQNCKNVYSTGGFACLKVDLNSLDISPLCHKQLGKVLVWLMLAVEVMWVSHRGGFACLKVVLKFGRKYTYHILNTYIPSVFIVVVSWISFWINPDAVPGRVTLGVTTVLTMTTQTFISGLSMPQVPYVKAIDVWMAVSMIFVFGALLEYAVVNEVQRRQRYALYKTIKKSKEESKKENGREDNKSTSGQSITSSDNIQYDHFKASSKSTLLSNTKYLKSDKIDKISQYLFPFLYIFFAVVYWVFYLNWTPDK